MTKIVARCTEHDEKTPSMILDLSNETYYCIGCGIRGYFGDVSNPEVAARVREYLENREE